MRAQKRPFPPEPKGWHQKTCSEKISLLWGVEGEKEGDRGAWDAGTRGSPSPRREDRRHALMEQGGGYSRKFPPSQNPACTLLVGALPKSSLLGITASPSFAAESNKSIFWLLERFPEFRVFIYQSLAIY